MQAQPAANRRVLTSRIGMRLIAMLVVCAMLPLAGFALVALDQVSQHLSLDAENSLHLAARNSGTNLAARILGIAADLELARAVLSEPQQTEVARRQLEEQLRERFQSVSVIADGSTKLLLGSKAHAVAPLTEPEREHLATGKNLLRVEVRPGRAPTLTLLRRLPAGGLLAAEVKNGRLFDTEDLRASGAEVMVFNSRGEYLWGSTVEHPDPAPLRASIQEQPAAGTIEWSLAGESHMAHYWRLFLQPQLGTDLLLVQSRATTLVQAPLHGFQWLFTWTTIIALLFVIVTGLVQIRRTLTPIGDLQFATWRVAAGDLFTPVPVSSKDELGELAQSFNTMTSQLQENIQRREASERQLTAARDDALTAARAKAEFMTNVSHELRTPLTSILAYAELLTSFPSDDEAQRAEFLEVINEQANYLTALIDKVLDLSISNQWYLRPTDIKETVIAAVQELPATCRPRISLQLPDKLPRVTGVHDRLVQLWGLLLDNACKFSPEGAPILVRAERRGDAAIAVAIVDHGDGIGPENLQRIFEPFCQVDRDIMTAKAKGVGLGLTLAKNIAERHDGRIEVESTPGQGSTFTVLLPLQPAIGSDAESEPAAATAN